MSVREHAISIEAFPIAETLEQELERAVREHSRTVYRIAFAVLRNREDAEDAAQEIFMRFLRARKRLVAIRGERAWLARAAWRVAISRRKREPQISLDDSVERVFALRDRGATADEIASQNEMAALLEKLIAALPRPLRQPLLLSTVEELSSPEIASILGIAEGSVRTRSMRAREILKQKLAALLEPRK
jgi:RNA polymerase sigma-70 factor, ECF subfamily